MSTTEEDLKKACQLLRQWVLGERGGSLSVETYEFLERVEEP